MIRNSKGQFVKGHEPIDKNKGRKFSVEHKEKLALAKIGRPGNHTQKHSLETKRRISKNQIGKHLREENPSWKGDEVGYFGLHSWIQKQLGKPETCEFCDKDGLTKHQIHWANKSHKYKRDLTDWLRLCVSCHQSYDRAYRSQHV